MKAFLTLFTSDVKQFTRDRVALFFTFAFPILFMLLFGAIFNNSNPSYTIGISDEDNSTVSQSVVTALRQVTILKLQTGSYDQELSDLKAGKINAMLDLPAGLAAAVAGQQTTPIKLYYDPSDTANSPVVLSIMNQTISAINQQITQQPILLALTPESIQTHALKYIDFLVPGILGMSILFLGLFSGITMVARREKMVLKRLGATPLKSSLVVVSQVLYRLLIALVQTGLIIGIAKVVFKVSMIGNWLELIAFVFLGAVTLISIGYFVVARAKTVDAAQPIIQLVQFPMLFLSGVFFPIDFMPAFLRPVINAMPLTYLTDAFRQIMVGAIPMHPILVDVGVLGAWLVVCMVLAIKLFKWE